MIGRSPVGPDPAADLEPVHARQHQVEHDDVGGRGGQVRQGPLAAFEGLDAVSLPRERDPQTLPYRGMVFDQQHP